MAETLYRQLQERLDMYSVGFPRTESGVEIRILKKMFSEEEAALFLKMTPLLQKPAAIAEAAGRDVEQVAEQLEEMAKKGLIFRLRKGEKVMYGASAFVVGSFEFQVGRIDKEYAQLIEDYFKEGFLSSGMGNSYPPLRTIPVHESIEPRMAIAPYRDAREIIKSKTRIALADCICRVQQGLLEKECDKPVDVCLIFGSHADYYVDNGIARYIDQETALDVLKRSEAAGLVTQPASVVNPGGMCNCCEDCCGVLRSLNLMEKPADMVMNDYWAVVDAENCTACETCTDRCQTRAVSLGENEIAVVNRDRCIGCGLCVTTCPSEAIILELKPEDRRSQPFESSMELWMSTAKKRGIDFTD